MIESNLLEGSESNWDEFRMVDFDPRLVVFNASAVASSGFFLIGTVFAATFVGLLIYFFFFNEAFNDNVSRVGKDHYYNGG